MASKLKMSKDRSYQNVIISLISSFSKFLTSSRLVRYFRLTAPVAVLGHLGATSLKNLTKRKEVRKLENKGADQAKYHMLTYLPTSVFESTSTKNI